MYDYHMHSSFSDDCTFGMEEMILAAINKGFDEIALTDHLDLDYPDPNFPFYLDIPAYHKALDQYQAKYHGQIKILRGIEIGIQDTVAKECKDVVHAHPYDFVIGSFHAAEGKDLYSGAYYQGKTTLQWYRDFYLYVYQCLKEYKDYNVLGHLNIVSRYAELMDHEPVPQESYLDLVEDILKLVIEDDKGIEVNTSSFRYHTSQLYPSVEMLTLYKKLKGEIITIGSDAHYPEHIGYRFKESIELLKTLGFRYFTTFEKMKPKFIKLDNF